MCNFLSSVGSWIGVNAIALAALVVAIVALEVGRRTLDRMKEQFDEERKERQDQAIAEQRYAIFQQLDLLVLHYIALIARQKGGSIQTAYAYDANAIRRSILILLARPTIMASEEISHIIAIING